MCCPASLALQETTHSTKHARPVVDSATYASGTSKSQQEGAKKLLSEIGVREIGEAEQVELILRRLYQPGE